MLLSELQSLSVNGPQVSNYFQFDAIKKYIDGGGSLLVMLGEGGESKYETNVNFLLEEYGIMFNNGMSELH